jgi:hypothetical protein
MVEALLAVLREETARSALEAAVIARELGWKREAQRKHDDLRRFILERFNAISDICNTTLLYNHMTRDEVVDAFYETLRKIDAVANYSSIMDEDEDDGKA